MKYISQEEANAAIYDKIKPFDYYEISEADLQEDTAHE